MTQCDRCGAKAMNKVITPAGALFFCGHHSREHADALTAYPVYCVDAQSVLDSSH